MGIELGRSIDVAQLRSHVNSDSFIRKRQF